MAKPPHDEGQKICNRCKGAPQPFANFDRRRSEVFGTRYSYCNVCKACKRAHRETKKQTDFPNEYYLPI